MSSKVSFVSTKIYHRILLGTLLVLCSTSLSLGYGLGNVNIRKRSAASSAAIDAKSHEGVHQRVNRLFGRKIDEEAKNMNVGSSKSGKKYGKNKSKGKPEENSQIPSTNVSSQSESIIEQETETETDSESAIEEKSATVPPIVPIALEAAFSSSVPTSADSPVNPDKPQTSANTSPFPTDNSVIKVPRDDPLNQSKVPPEVVFFGDPRRPPPLEAANDLKYHGKLLGWARHATVVPRNSKERLDAVFPKGGLHPQADKYRLPEDREKLTFEAIFSRFTEVMDDLEASKAFISSNIDLVPSKLFMRALTARKLAAQSRPGEEAEEEMYRLKEIREKYILASHQLFFPLNIEVQKAETRVMTFLAREEIKSFAEQWDEVEMTLHFTTLLAARLTWDEKVTKVLDDIKEKVSSTVGYMAEGIRKQLMSREFRKPGVTAEVYTNASLVIERKMPSLYRKVRPEVRAVHETYFLRSSAEKKAYIEREFLAKEEGLTIEKLREALLVFEASLANIQGVDYVALRFAVSGLYSALFYQDQKGQEEDSDRELRATYRWYERFLQAGYGFETYEPDQGKFPMMVKVEQRLRDTGSAFSNFNVQVLKSPTIYTRAFSGARPKGSDVGNWLERDSDWNIRNPDSQEERLDIFRDAYIKQSGLRQEAESRLGWYVDNRMAAQDRAIMASTVVMELDDSENSEDSG